MNVEDPFVGRLVELTRLRACALSARAGRPGLVLIEGEAGIGKTELLRHWLSDPSLRAFTVLRARCDTSEQDFVFGVVQQLISSAPGSLVGELSLLTGRIPASTPPYEVGGRLLELLGTLQSEQPVVLLIDDVQWADAASLQACSFVLRRLEADAVLTVLTARSTGDGHEPHSADALRRLVGAVPGSVRMALRGLDVEHVSELITRVTGQMVTTDIAEGLRDHTAGNPLYMSTLLAELPDGPLTETSLRALPVPSSLTAAIRSQLAHLPGPSQALVEAVAVLGVPSPLAKVGWLAEVEDPSSAVEAALQSGLMRWRPDQAAAPVEIAHAMQRQAVIETIAPDRLRHLHAAAVHLVDRHTAWAHRVAAAGPLDLQLAAELVDAADEAFAAGEADRSATLLLWAADLEVTRAGRERHLLRAVERLLAIEQLTRVAALMPRVRASAPCAARSLALGAQAMHGGTLPAAEAHYLAALEESEEEGETHTEITARTALSAVLNFLGRYDEGIEAARRALELDPSITYAWVNLCTGLALAQGPQTALRELSQVTPTVLRATPETGPHDVALLSLRGILRIASGSLRRGAEDCRTALELGRAHSVSTLSDFTHTHLATAQYLLGDWEDVPINCERGLAITANGEGRTAACAWEYAALCWLAAGRGEWAAALEHLHAVESRSVTDRVDTAHTSALCAVSRAIYAQARGDHQAMLTAVEPLAQAKTGWARQLQVYWLPLRAEALIGLGRMREAEAEISHLRATAEDFSCLRASASWLGGRLASHRGNLTLARITFEEGLASLCQTDAPLLHTALLEHDYGLVLRHSGHMTAADKWLNEARQRLRRVQARPFLERCAQDLSQPAQPATTTREAVFVRELSAREREIAHLVGRGLTNKEIGKELFVSSKTVEYHLSHVYEKLALTNRRELRDHVQRGILAQGN
ncbi:AAA family ATPase [Streptomyces griseofuscus]|uniref:helix-turn-helix transcriptional regulator n=1 Tax=Streptomyces griseofuscus TaxID=146922 RepID=UPI0036C9B4B8